MITLTDLDKHPASNKTLRIRTVVVACRLCGRATEPAAELCLNCNIVYLSKRPSEVTAVLVTAAHGTVA